MRKYFSEMRFAFILTVSLFLFLNACAKKQTIKEEAKADAQEALENDSVQSQELDIHGKEFVSVPELKTINFDYDSTELSDSARKTLSENFTYLKKIKGAEVLVEGHCDQRGTVNYNIALGQQRAAAVRRYYISLGLKQKSVGALSYGREKLICEENTEDCWAKNRRVETRVRVLSMAQPAEKKSVTSAQKNDAADPISDIKDRTQ